MIKRKGKAGSRTSRRRKQRKASMRQADKAFSTYIKDRDGWACRHCGRVAVVMQCAHLVSRRYRAVRWSPDNAVALCAPCHVRYTFRPLEWEAWIEERFPGRLAELKARALAGVAHVDYGEVLEQIRSFRL